MAVSQTVLQVFLASPGDVKEERKVLESVVEEFNQTWAHDKSVRLELIKWETHVRPAVGNDGQDVVNEQIGDEYDIFIGIMWKRFGTKTNRAGSGTEEEFERAFSRLIARPGSLDLMFYFKNAAVKPNDIDEKQLSKVKSFKNRLLQIDPKHGALYHEFENIEEFTTAVRMHLSRAVQDWLKKNDGKSFHKFSNGSNPTPKDPLTNLNAIRFDDDEEGLIELAQHTKEAMEKVVSVANKITEATVEIGEEFRERSEEVKPFNIPGATLDALAIKKISNNAADNLELYVRRVSAEIPDFQKWHSEAMDSWGKVAMILTGTWDLGESDLAEALSQIKGYRTSIKSAISGISEFRESTARLPKMTTAFNRARKRAVAVTDDLLEQLNSADRQAERVVEIISDMGD